MSKQYGFHMDTGRCIKCCACEIACKQWNGIPAGGIKRRTVHEIDEGTFPNVSRTFVSLSCLHCAEPACAAVCPAGAISKRSEDGIVVVDKDKCIGCHYCFFACPFGIPQYDENGMDKCDCCIGNGVTPGDTPHCVAACPTQALKFGTSWPPKCRSRRFCRWSRRTRSLRSSFRSAVPRAGAGRKRFAPGVAAFLKIGGSLWASCNRYGVGSQPCTSSSAD